MTIPKRTTAGRIEILTSDRITQEEQHGIEYIMAYDFAAVREKVLKERTLPESIVDEAIVEFRKWLILIRLGYGSVAMCSWAVDEVWHTFILFTRNYMAFCNQVFGYYLHHEPATNAMPVPKSAEHTFYTGYGEVFGTLPPLWSERRSEARADDTTDPDAPQRSEPDAEPDRDEPDHDESDHKPDSDGPDDGGGKHCSPGCYGGGCWQACHHHGEPGRD